MKTKMQILDEQHWRFRDYKQRITHKDWKQLLLNDDDNVIFEGRVIDKMNELLNALESNTGMTIDIILEKIKNKTDQVLHILGINGFSKINFDIELNRLSPGIAGCAKIYQNKIMLSIDYLREHFEEIINQTLPHEICHIYVTKYFPEAKQHHGKEFRMLMNCLGLEGKTYHNMVLKDSPNKTRRTKTRYVYVAENSGQKYMLTPMQHNKQLSGRSKFVAKGTGEILKYFGETVNYI
jgi:predicted SprT family Zn-dependent metalloprotease